MKLDLGCDRPARLRCRRDAGLCDGCQSNGTAGLPECRMLAASRGCREARRCAIALARPLGLQAAHLRRVAAGRGTMGAVERQPRSRVPGRSAARLAAFARRRRSTSRCSTATAASSRWARAFDAFTPLSHHARTDVPPEAQRNRLLLMGLMTSAGWDFYRNEWWHYQLFDAARAIRWSAMPTCRAR